ncbi:DinB family protein [Rummeliibacillus sp. G93]|uniref:DinB family protein n=1 Tax=Rummeliibacillus sp. G93 TaxID=2939494 RepID=UPI00201C2216|nr:DinB family protein [Rummeliibacillus sp. G93]UQW95981.1 DinB family protein [Rummeliibacillus sp. G93]
MNINGRNKIIKHHQYAIEFVRSLNNLREEQWRRKIEEGKWTVAEIIGHLIPWDEFIINNRLPYLFSVQELPIGPDVKTLNATSAHNAREQEKKVIITDFILVRSELLQKIEGIPDIRWKEEITIGQTTLNLYDYFEGLAEHDQHHFNQIKEILHKK